MADMGLHGVLLLIMACLVVYCWEESFTWVERSLDVLSWGSDGGEAQGGSLKAQHHAGSEHHSCLCLSAEPCHRRNRVLQTMHVEERERERERERTQLTKQSPHYQGPTGQCWGHHALVATTAAAAHTPVPPEVDCMPLAAPVGRRITAETLRPN